MKTPFQSELYCNVDGCGFKKDYMCIVCVVLMLFIGCGFCY